MPARIRTLHAADFEQWRDLWAGYLAFYETTLPDDIYRTTFDRLIDADHPQQQALVAEQDGRLCGLVHYIFHPHNWRIEDVCYLQDLYVDPGVRRGGTGRALIEAVYEAAGAQGIGLVYWLTQDFNASARRLYDRVAEVTPFIRYQRALPIS